MRKFTINDFWTSRMSAVSRQSKNVSTSLVKGWSFINTRSETFIEAPLTLSAEFDDSNSPDYGSIFLISAPGAVGKSTLAKEIAFVTGSVYIDLAESDPVGANTLIGGIAKSGLQKRWNDGSMATLIDGLDEARLKVTQEAFQAFLVDVAEVSKDREVPTVIFGRTGAVQDAWIILNDQCSKITVLEIGYFGPEESINFAEVLLRKLKHDNSHKGVEREALGLSLEKLRDETKEDGDRFSGYAPVLQAVAKYVAEEGNPGALVKRIQKGSQSITLKNIVRTILEREKGKLSNLSFKQKDISETLYSPDEQLNRLVARVYNLPEPELPEMCPEDRKTYSTALGTWVSEHPFLDGDDGASSVVFDAAISAKALLNSTACKQALQKMLSQGATANPFLFKFYRDEVGESKGAFTIQGDHIGVVYASLRASLPLGDIASLSIEESTDAEENEDSRTEVEITIIRRNEDTPRIIRFVADQNDLVHLGAYVEDVDIVLPRALVEIGPGSEATLIAPVNIQCQELLISTKKVIAKNPSGQKATVVFLEASEFDETPMRSVPVVRGDVELSASWPGVRKYPWSNFASEPSPSIDPQSDEALRRFRKFVISFRSHGKSHLARFKGKIEHARMTKGAGQKVLDLMVDKGILSLQGRLYYLNVEKLAELTGTTYHACVARHFDQKAIFFIREALENSEE